jgi:ABC-type phosphate/phosphonate transport system ATPase subunit
MTPAAPDSTAPPDIEFRCVSIAFDGKPALTAITFSLNRGEMILITGAAASGKSVLLRLAIGLCTKMRICTKILDEVCPL